MMANSDNELMRLLFERESFTLVDLDLFPGDGKASPEEVRATLCSGLRQIEAGQANVSSTFGREENKVDVKDFAELARRDMAARTGASG